MLPPTSSFAEEVLRAAIAGGQPNDALFAALDQIPAPIYATNAYGYVAHFNSQCVELAGRVPQAGQDRWCVTWKLFTNGGEVLPHEKCPMAEAVRGRRAIRGATAVAERPDGTKVSFMPFPTPLFDEDGEFTGAVNMLVDINERQQPGELRRLAERYFLLARRLGDPELSAKLDLTATQYQIKASALDLLNSAA